jgi:class I fructose-bisphosphate aldolase
LERRLTHGERAWRWPHASKKSCAGTAPTIPARSAASPGCSITAGSRARESWWSCRSTYHFELAIEAGCNAYAAPLGFLEAGARDYAGRIPLILKLNDSDSLRAERDPDQALTGSVADALRLGCSAIGFTIYPGSGHRMEMYGQLRALAEEAKRCGLAVVVWSYPRGGDISSEGETAIDVVGYAAQIAAQLGAHIIKVKLPSGHIEQPAAKKVYEAQKIPIATQAERVRHIVDCAFGGRRIVIFSGGAAIDDDKLFGEIRAIHAGGGFGSILGRNSFQRPRADALRMLRTVMDVYAAPPAADWRRRPECKALVAPIAG